MKRHPLHVTPGPGRKLLLCLAAGLVAATAPPLHARADSVTLSANYYTLASNDPDVEQGISGAIYNEVRPTLGPNGLPVLNVAMYGCPSDCYGSQPIHDINPATGELTYFSPGMLPSQDSHSTYTGSGTVQTPYNNGNMFPPGGTGTNGNGGTVGFQAADFFAALNVPTTEYLQFTVGADDDAFVYLDNALVCSVGGVHVNNPGICTTPTVSAGTHTLSLFYADLHTTQASLTFSVDTAGVTNVTPEPPSILLLGSSLLAMGAFTLRRRSLDAN